jgi:hypothetical protein
MDDRYADAPAMDERGMDTDIISDLALSIIDDANGMDNLIAAANNTPDPAKGVAQYLMMLFDAINKMLEQTGIPFDFSVVAAKGGVMDTVLPEIQDILAEASVPVDETFVTSTTNYFLEMVKGAAQSEGAAQPPSPTAGAGGLLDSVGGMM